MAILNNLQIIEKIYATLECNQLKSFWLKLHFFLLITISPNLIS
jgi:hypothetical protein